MSSVSRKECERVRERLPEYADGSLVGPGRARLEQHLRGCPRCSAELDDVRTVIRALRDLGPEAVPEGLVPRLREAVGQPRSAPATLPRLWPRIAVPVAVAACLAAVLFAVQAPRRATVSQSAAPASGPTESVGEARGPRIAAARTMPEEKAIALVPVEDSRGAAGLLSEGEPVPGEAPASVEGDFYAADGTVGEEGRAPPAMGGMGGGGARGGRGPEAPGAGSIVRPRLETRAPYRRRGPGGPPGEREPMDAAAEPAQEALAVTARRGDAVGRPFAQAVQLRDQAKRTIALQLEAEVPQQNVVVNMTQQGNRQQIWQGAAPFSAPVVISAEQVGPSPAAIPISIESPEGHSDYVLFLPAMMRLGETAKEAPTGSYRGEPLFQILAEFTALTGLVVLAEEPLSQTMHGEKPKGAPDAALQEIAARTGLELQRTDEIVFNLSYPR